MLYVVGWGLMVLANMPIAFTLGVTAFLFLWIDGGPLVSAPQRLIAGIDSFPLLAVPAFIVAGEVMTGGRPIYQPHLRLRQGVRRPHHRRPGPRHVAANVIMSGMSGSAVADAASIGTLIIRAMKDEGYERRYAGR